MNTRFAHLRAILILPFNVLVVVPSLLLWRTPGSWQLAGPGDVRLWGAIACFAAGLGLMTWTIRRFANDGDGTLAPWDPTRRLVVAGVYRHVRNPMISGVVTNLVGESLLFGSTWLAGWAATFFLLNALFIPLWEEPDLEKRFGEEYRRYKTHVPRWIPRRTPWAPDDPAAAGGS